MGARNSPATEPMKRELTITRSFDAPRELEWSAWKDPKQLAQWWGPNGFTNTFHEFDPRPGGHWRFTMHGPDGADYPNESVFVDIAKPASIVFNHLTTPKFQMLVRFEDLSGKTRLTSRMRFESAAECEQIRAFVTEKNNENLDRLAVQLAKMR